MPVSPRSCGTRTQPAGSGAGRRPRSRTIRCWPRRGGSAADVVDALQTFALPLDFRGTAFQTAVRTALLAIPYGATRSDAEIARAVGAAGAPTGFAGGLARERHRPGLEGAGIFALAPPV